MKIFETASFLSLLLSSQCKYVTLEIQSRIARMNSLANGTPENSTPVLLFFFFSSCRTTMHFYARNRYRKEELMYTSIFSITSKRHNFKQLSRIKKLTIIVAFSIRSRLFLISRNTTFPAELLLLLLFAQIPSTKLNKDINSCSNPILK